MTTKQLSFKGPPSLAIAAGAVSPNPGINGVQVWSTTENALVFWDSNSWELVDGGGGGGTTLASDTYVVPRGQVWGPSPFSTIGGSTHGNVGAGGVGTFVQPTSGSTTAENLNAHHTFTASGSTYSNAGVGGADYYFKAGAGTRGFIFESMVDFATTPNNSNGFVGVFDGTGVYGNLSASSSAVGVGYDGADTGTSLYLITCDGTTKTRTLLSRGSGSSGRKFTVRLVCPDNTLNANITVTDNSNGFVCLDNFAVTIPANNTTSGLNGVAGLSTNTQTGAVLAKIFSMWCIPYPKASSTAAVVNITGSATTLETPRSIQGVAFDGSQDINLISIGTTAPASPFTNQLWIQT